MHTIQQVAVLGAGTMGSRIAAHFANAGVPALLLDLASSGGDRNAIAKRGLETAGSQKPQAFFVPANAALVQTGNFDDDLEKIAGCQWVIEAVTEDLGIKRELWGRVTKLSAPDAILSTNTSGIRLAEIARDFPGEAIPRFLGTHFFNPPRYLHLVEVIPGPGTDSQLLDFVTKFAERTLGKGVVRCKDTPNFIANRIGSFLGAAIHRKDPCFCTAWPNAAKMARDTSFSRQRHSGCHCSPSRNPFADGIDTASIVPSGAIASA